MRPLHFLLFGNTPYRNRGSEVIVRGSMEILPRAFGPEIRATVASYGPLEQVAEQAAAASDAAIEHVPLEIPRHSLAWFQEQVNKRLGTCFDGQHRPFSKHLRTAVVAFEIGGDNYSLDYGVPT